MNEAILTRKKVIELTGRSATSLWRDCQAGVFPKPRQVSAARIGWLASEVEKWLQSRPVVASNKAPTKNGKICLSDPNN